MELSPVLDHSPLDQVRRVRDWLQHHPPLSEITSEMARLREVEQAALDARSELLAYYLEASGLDIDDDLPADLLNSPDDIIV